MFEVNSNLVFVHVGEIQIDDVSQQKSNGCCQADKMREKCLCRRTNDEKIE